MLEVCTCLSQLLVGVYQVDCTIIFHIKTTITQPLQPGREHDGKMCSGPEEESLGGMEESEGWGKWGAGEERGSEWRRREGGMG